MNVNSFFETMLLDEKITTAIETNVVWTIINVWHMVGILLKTPLSEAGLGLVSIAMAI